MVVGTVDEGRVVVDTPMGISKIVVGEAKETLGKEIESGPDKRVNSNGPVG